MLHHTQSMIRVYMYIFSTQTLDPLPAPKSNRNRFLAVELYKQRDWAKDIYKTKGVYYQTWVCLRFFVYYDYIIIIIIK